MLKKIIIYITLATIPLVSFAQQNKPTKERIRWAEQKPLIGHWQGWTEDVKISFCNNWLAGHRISGFWLSKEAIKDIRENGKKKYVQKCVEMVNEDISKKFEDRKVYLPVTLPMWMYPSALAEIEGWIEIR